MEQIEQMVVRMNELELELVALKTAKEEEEEEYHDPPLYTEASDGTPIPISWLDVPSGVRDIRDFSGDPSELDSWIQDVEGYLEALYAGPQHSLERQNLYYTVCKCIRRRIRGEANDALIATNVSLNWKHIKKTLITYYGEKRDLQTLDYQLMTVSQKGRSLELYYDDINRLTTLIANHIKTDDRYRHPNAKKALLETYGKKQ